MNSRAFTVAFIIAILAMLMVESYLESEKSSFVKKYGTPSSVVVAKVDIQEFEPIDDRKVAVIQVPQNFLAPGHLKTVKEVLNTIATVPILKGEQLTKPRITYPGAKTGLARQISPNKRGIAINVSEDQAVGKLLKPGDRVDVLALIDYGGGKKDLQKVKTILQDIPILSTGLAITNSLPVVGIKDDSKIRKLNLNTYSNFNSVSLELDPFQAQKLIFLITAAGAKPYLTLRNNSDRSIVRIKSTRLYDLLGEDADEAKVFFKSKGNPRGGR